MSKVTLTQEQADAFKKLKESIKANHEKFRSKPSSNLTDWEYVLLDIPTEEYLSAMFEGYEVEPTFRAEEIAEEKRRRWWRNRDRGVWELRVRDILKRKGGYKLAEVKKVRNSEYLIGTWDSYANREDIEKYYTVVCLAENREDVEE